jgi:UDP-N-acetylglucosamine 1-carboxyvinyltransferase
MHQYLIEGGHPLNGSITASGNKNAALPCITAAILTDEEVVLRNIPNIEDVQVLFDILRDLGGSVEAGENSGDWRIKMTDIRSSEISQEMSQKIRASILLAGPLLARSGKVVLPPPGGDVIGRRRLDTHLLVLQALGAEVKIDGVFSFNAARLIGDDIFLDEASVTATENAIMAAALAEGTTILRNAASEPHVQDLCNMINAMGGRVSGIGSNILTIEGVKKLHGADFSIGADFMEVGSYIGLAAATRGELVIHRADPHHLRMVRMGFAKLGIQWETDGDSIRVAANQRMQVVSDLGGMIPKIDDAPWPGFPPDLLSIILTVATQVEGTILIHEKMFESRMFFVDKLIGMGAKIVLCDPHRAVISGPSPLSASSLVSPDVRAGMAMVIAALAADGVSTIQNIYQIERGYEDLVGKLNSLGARITREDV